MIDLASIPVSSLLEGAALSPEAASLLTPDMSAQQAIKVLGKNRMSQDAVPVLAEALPEREGVWWACESCRRTPMSPEGVQAVDAAEAWVRSPSPETAKIASDAASVAGHESPGGWAAQAAAWADPSITGEAASAGLSKKATAGAVRLAAVNDAGMMPEAAPVVAGDPPAEPPSAKASALESPPPDPDNPPPPPEIPPPPEDQPPTPKEQRKVSKATDPYLKLGQEIASGSHPW